MKILMVSHGFPPECLGGTERYVASLSEELRRQQHEVAVFCGSHEGAGPGAREPRLVATHHREVPVYRLHRTGLFVDDWAKSLAPEVEERLDEVLDRVQPDLVHVHHWIRLTRTLIARCHERGIPALATVHDLWPTCPIAFRVRDGAACDLPAGSASCAGCAPRSEGQDDAEYGEALDLFRDDHRNELLLARRLIVPSPAHRDLLLQHVPEAAGRFRVVPHGNLFDEEARALETPVRSGGERLRIGHWGHLSRLKGLDLLLDAVRADDLRDRVRLELFGELVFPDEREAMRERARGLDVHWHGRYVPRDLRQVELDLAVIPSRCRESWSFVLDEAFGLGLPAIVARHGALPERLEGAGGTFTPGDAHDLGRALREVLEDPSLLGRWRRAIPQPTSMAEHGDRVLRTYREVLTSAAELPLTPPELVARRTRFLAGASERRNRALEEREAIVANLRKDLERAGSAMEEMAHYHREKDKEIARLRAEADELRTRLQGEVDALRARVGEMGALEDELRELRREHLAARSQHEHAERTRRELQELREQDQAIAAKIHSFVGELLMDYGDPDHAPTRRDAMLDLAVPDGGPALYRLEEVVEELGAALRLATSGTEKHSQRARQLHAEVVELREKVESQEEVVEELRKNSPDGESGRRDAERMGSSLRHLIEDLGRHQRRGRPVRASRGKKLKILMVLHQFLPRHVAGTEIYVARLSRGLRAVGHEVVLLTAESDHSRARFEHRVRTFEGMKVHEIIHNYEWRGLRDTYDCPEADERFRQVLQEEDPDLLHVHHLHYHSANYVTIAAERGIPVLHHLHDYLMLCPRDGQLRRADGSLCAGPDPKLCAGCVSHHRLDGPPPPLPRSLRPGWDAVLPEDMVSILTEIASDEEQDPHAEAIGWRLSYLQQVMKDVDLFVAPSAFAKERYVESGLVQADRIKVSDNGLETAHLKAWRKPWSKPRDRLRVGYVGSICEHKGVHVLLEAMNRLVDDGRVSAHVWGHLDAFVDYTRKLVHCVRNPRTTLMGGFPPERLPEILTSLDVLVVPSLWFENAPLTIREAALVGVPVLTSDLGGMRESIVEGRSGLLFPPGDDAALATLLTRLLDDPALLADYDPDALPVKDIAEDVEQTVATYRGLLRREVPATLALG